MLKPWCTYLLCIVYDHLLVFEAFHISISLYFFTWKIKIDFFYHMQLAGGTASMQQLKERLEKDLLEVYILTNDPLSILFRVQGFISWNETFCLCLFCRLELNIFGFSIRLVECFCFYLKKNRLVASKYIFERKSVFLFPFGSFLNGTFICKALERFFVLMYIAFSLLDFRMKLCDFWS